MSIIEIIKDLALGWVMGEIFYGLRNYWCFRKTKKIILEKMLFDSAGNLIKYSEYLKLYNNRDEGSDGK
jgi:hypothetical protein